MRGGKGGPAWLKHRDQEEASGEVGIEIQQQEPMEGPGHCLKDCNGRE